MLVMLSRVFLTRVTWAKVYNITAGIEKALGVIVPPARKEQMMGSWVFSISGVPHTEPGIQFSDVELVFVRCGLQHVRMPQRKNTKTVQQAPTSH